MRKPIPLAVTLTENISVPDRLNATAATIVFLAFAAACFCSALPRLMAALAGRALSAYNLVIFAGVFVAQGSLGLLIDSFSALGLGHVARFQAAMAAFLCCCIAAHGYFLSVNADNSPQ